MLPLARLLNGSRDLVQSLPPIKSILHVFIVRDFMAARLENLKNAARPRRGFRLRIDS